MDERLTELVKSYLLSMDYIGFEINVFDLNPETIELHCSESNLFSCTQFEVEMDYYSHKTKSYETMTNIVITTLELVAYVFSKLDKNKNHA